MALKILRRQQDLRSMQAQMETLVSERDAFAAREHELEADIAAAQTEEDRAAVDAAIDEFEQQRNANVVAIAELQTRIDATTEEIRSLEAAQTPPPAAGQPAAPAAERSNNTMPMTNPERRWLGLTYQERDALLQAPETRDFLSNIRALRTSQRSASGAELGIPDNLLPMLRDLTYQYSRVLPHISLQPVGGTSRQNIAGVAPEAIWTEMDAVMNELDINFYQLTMDGFMIGGYLALPNYVLSDDTDLSLLTTVVQYLAAAIAKGLDKACIYGTGTKMPVGIITRLAATSKPEWWGANQDTFTDLHESHVLKLDLGAKYGAEFFQKLCEATGVPSPNYSDGRAVWFCNRKTHLDIVSRSLNFNAAAALVAGVSGTMPVIGGEFVELEFMQDYDVCGGFGSLYSLSQREGVVIDSNVNVKWRQNMTCFKGLARYDGKPAIGEAFVLFNYKNTAPKTTTTFGVDYINEGLGTLIVTTAAGASGKTTVTVAGNASANKLRYKLAGAPLSVEAGEKLAASWSAMTSGAAVAAATGNVITVVEIDSAGKAVKLGSATCTAGA